MDGKSKFIAGLLLGAAAGAAVALFLQSEKGKEMMSTVKDAADDLMQKGKQFVQDLQSEDKDEASPA